MNILLDLCKYIFIRCHPCQQNLLWLSCTIFLIQVLTPCRSRSFHRLCKSGLNCHSSDQFFQIFTADMISPCNCINVVIALYLFIKLCKLSRSFLHKVRSAFRRRHIIIPFQNFKTEHKSIPCLLNPFFKGFCTEIFNKFIWIFIRFHPNDLRRNPNFTQNRSCPQSCFRSCLVTVICQVDFIDIPFDKRCMSWCQGCSKWRYCIGKSRLMQGNHIHIALTKQKIRLSRLSCTIQSIQVPAFVKNDRLWWVQILWLCITHDTAAKSNNTAVYIHNRKHDPVPELIVNSVFFINTNQTCLWDHIVFVAFWFQILVQIITVLIRISQTKCFDRIVT